MIDDEDRQAIVMGAVRVIAVAFLVVVGAIVAGVALRAFQIVSGV